MTEILLISAFFFGLVLIFILVQWILFLERKKNKFSPFTENSLRSPGYSLGAKIDDSISDTMAPLMALAFLPIVYFVTLTQFTTTIPTLSIIPFLILVIVFARQFILKSSDVRKQRLGLDGEVYTGQELNYLMRDGAYVYHDIPYKYGNIDHVVISTGGVFVVETKAFRKPADSEGKRQSKVSYKDGKLYFPTFTTASPVQQAIRHADHMRAFIKGSTGKDIPVTPVIALPGWFIENTTVDGPLIINPKRGNALRSFAQKPILSAETVDTLAHLVEGFVRSVWSSTEKFDPDASDKFTFWLDRKPEEKKIQ